MSPVPTGVMTGSLPISLISPAHPANETATAAMDISALMSGFFPVRRDLRCKHAMGQMRGAGRLHFVEYRACDARRELGDYRGSRRIVHDSKLRGRGIGLHMHIDRDDVIVCFFHGLIVLLQPFHELRFPRLQIRESLFNLSF